MPLSDLQGLGDSAQQSDFVHFGRKNHRVSEANVLESIGLEDVFIHYFSYPTIIIQEPVNSIMIANNSSLG